MNRKSLFTTGLLATSLVAASSGMAVAEETEGKRIAFFVSDMTNVFHQNQAIEAQRYGAEEYGAEVVVFDGQADSAVMTQNVDQVLAGGFDGATLHIWDGEAATPGINDALAQDIAMTSFFSPITDTGIPTARSDEAGVSFEMGKQMAEEWKRELLRQEGERSLVRAQENEENLAQKLYDMRLETDELTAALYQKGVEVAVLTEFSKELQERIAELEMQA